MQIIKKATSLFLAVIILLSMTVIFSSADNEVKGTEGTNIILENVEVRKEGAYTIVTFENQDEENGAVVYSYPEREKIKSFYHVIYDRNNISLATFYVTVKGLYSSAEHYATITSVTGYFTGEFASDFTYSVSYNGDTAYAYIYFNGVLATTLTYRLYTNGSLQNI